jgi:hypothetical protein
VDYAAEKIDRRHVRMAVANALIEAVGTGAQPAAQQQASEPLKGVLVGLVLSVPIWAAAAFLAVKLF